MTQIIISNLPPAPPLTGSGMPKGTDLVPATDATAITSLTPTGVTNKYTQAAILNFYLGAMGLHTYQAVKVATTTALTATYSNGTAGVGATLTNAGVMAALVIDSVPLAVNDRILVWNQGASFQNGLYSVSNIGTLSANWVLTRATDYDTTAEIVQDGVILVNQGSTYTGRLFQEIAATPIIIGTNPILFDLFNLISNQTFIWNDVISSSMAMMPNQGYVSDNAGLVTLSIPISSNFGDEIAVSGKGLGGWIITMGAGQTIAIGTISTSSGGSVASRSYTDSIRLVCIVPNLQWTTTGGPQGSLTIL
jgi:hypothetical protein